MDIINTSSTQEIIRQKKCQMWKLDKLVFKQYIEFPFIINEIPIWQMLFFIHING